MSSKIATMMSSGQRPSSEDYDEIEFYLQQAQDEIGQAMSVLTSEGSTSRSVTKDTSLVAMDTPCIAKEDDCSFSDHSPHKDYDRGYYSLGHPRKKCSLKLDCKKANKDQGIVDFHSIFTSSDTIDEDFFHRLETPDSERSWSSSTLPSTTSRPHRPQTLTPPISLPKCCNFRNRDWRFYISGNFNTDDIADSGTEYVDPLDSLLSENRSSLGSTSTTNDLKRDKTYKYYIPSPAVDDHHDNDAIVEKLDSDGKKIYTFSVSSTIDAPKASSTYQSLSSSTSDGSSTKFPIEIARRSTDDETDTKKFPQKEAFDSVAKIGSKSVDNISNCINKNSTSVDYVSTRWIINAEDMTQSTPALSQTVDRTMAEVGSQSTGCIGSVTMPVQNMVRENPEGSSDNHIGDEEKSVSGPRTKANGPSTIQSEPPPLSPRSPRIKTNGLLLSPKRTMRERRLRVRSDPSRMLTERVPVYHGEECGHKVACVQTENTLDGIMSPPMTRHASPVRDVDIRRSVSSSPDREEYKSPPPLPDKHEYRLKCSSSSSTRQRSQSADRFERNPHHGRCRRDKSESPDRRRTRSPVKMGCGMDRSMVSKVSRSTQTHRSIVKYGSNKIAVSSSTNVSSPQTTSTKPTIHVQLDDVLRTSLPEGTTANIDQSKVKTEQSSMVKVSAIKDFKPLRPGVTVISTVKGDKQSSEEQSITVIKCENIGKQSRKSKKSSKSKMTSSVSTKSRIQTPVDGEDSRSSARSDSTVIYVPSRESRRIQVRPQMPAIAEDSLRCDDEDNDTDMSSTMSSTHHKTIQYYGSLKTERTTDDDNAIISASLSKSANDVNTDKQKSANSLLDTLHRKYYPAQYTPTSKTRSVELLPEPVVKDASGAFVTMSKLYAHKNKLSGLHIHTEQMDSISSGDQPSSPSPEETRGNQQEEMFFECCDHVTAECDIKSFQKLMNTDRECAEIEAIEACKWLRAAGFPQYAQMYEENLFPVDVSTVEKDHDFLDTDSMQSLFRRLNTLNKCVSMKIEAPTRKSGDESDEEDACALSDKWRYQRSSRRWSRKDLEDIVVLPGAGTETPAEDKLRSCSSHDSVITDNEESLNQESPTLTPLGLHLSPSNSQHSGQPSPTATRSPGLVTDSNSDNVPLSPTAFKRSASEKFKIAKNSIFKRMESLKSRKGSFKGKQQGKLGMGKLEIGSPVLVESRSVQERMDRLGCKDISPSTETSPNLSTGSRNMSSPGPHDVTADSDSVFLDAQTEDDVVCVVSHNGGEKRRNRSESAVSDLIINEEYSVVMGDPRTVSHVQEQDISVISDRENANNTSQHKYRSSSFSVTNHHNHLHGNGYSRTHSDTHLEANNNVDKGEVLLRETKDPALDPECRLSVYDNVPPDPECGEAVRELDLIVQNLMQDISELNASWGLNNQGDSLDTFPLELTLEDALQDFSSEREGTLTRKSHTNNKNLASFDIPVLPVVHGAPNKRSSSSSSSSTISHSNGSVIQNSPHHNDIVFDPSEIFTPAHMRSDSSHACQDPDSSHVHVLGMDETLDAILRNLESHYGATAMSNDNKLSHVDANKNVVMDPDVDSTSLSNQELSDPDLTPDLTSGSREEEDDEEERHESRERRDSGVGSSLTREPSDRRRYRIRWHSFVKSHRPSFNSRDLQINVMSAGQLKLLRKFSLLKITALMEKYSLNRSGWNWAMPMNKLMRRFKVATDYKDRKVFGVPLQLIVQRTGQPLPQCILHAMRCLRKNAHDSVGIFRKSGVRSRIQKLRDQIELDPELVSFDNLQAYDVADLLKQYFRELPECLLTNKLSETFISIFTHVPTDQRLEALYSAVMLLPDENREVLQSLLLFLSDMADYAKQNQMNASNLAVCFAPSLFHLCGSRGASASPKRNRKKDGIPDQRELQEQKAAHECLTEMIVHSKKIFMVPADTLRMCHFSYMDQCSPVSLSELGRRRPGEDSSETGHYTVYLESCIQGLLKESRDKFKGWVSVGSQTTVDLAYKKIDDGYSLRLWKCSVEIEAPPSEVLNRVCRERQLWDEDFLKWRVVETLDQNTEVFQYVLNNLAPHPTRDFCELRHWRTDLPKGACVLVSTSVDHHPGDTPLMGGVTGVVLASRYLIEPCGAGKSRLTHISRVDLRGHNPEWYNKVYGHLCANLICHIRDSFSQKTDGPETNV